MPGTPVVIENGEHNASRLRADCTRCAGLCCVALPFTASAGFPADKAAGTACHHLDESFRCGIHADLRSKGFTGCTVFDCFGAGQRVTQETFEGRTWRDGADTARRMFGAFAVVRHLHEMLWYLAEALDLAAAAPLREELRRQFRRIDTLAGGDADAFATVNVAAVRQDVGPLLGRVSELVRAEVRSRGGDRRGADLAGATLRGKRLAGTTLRGAVLIAADLRRADLRTVEFLGADLRDTDLRGADLTGAFFLTQAQLNAALGDTATRLPDKVRRPAHW